VLSGERTRQSPSGLAETTRRKKAPSPASLDREVELLKRMLNYAVSCGSLPSNPIAAVKLLRKPNVRRSVLDDAAFEKLLAAAETQLKPIIWSRMTPGCGSARSSVSAGHR